MPDELIWIPALNLENEEPYFVASVDEQRRIASFRQGRDLVCLNVHDVSQLYEWLGRALGKGTE